MNYSPVGHETNVRQYCIIPCFRSSDVAFVFPFFLVFPSIHFFPSLSLISFFFFLISPHLLEGDSLEVKGVVKNF